MMYIYKDTNHYYLHPIGGKQNKIIKLPKTTFCGKGVFVGCSLMSESKNIYCQEKAEMVRRT